MDRVTARERLIVALDLQESESLALASHLQGRVGWLKVGMTLFYEAGPRIISELRAMGFDIFLDLKLHDIPHQVRGAAETVSRHGVGMLTVHAAGGAEMVAAAAEGADAGAMAAGVVRPSVLAVTVLTSMDDAGLATIGVERTAAAQVLKLARLATDAGADGIVCSPNEASDVRSVIGDHAWIVTPGVRPSGSEMGDQSRVATPMAALSAGASHVVIGRPITASSDPLEAVERIVEEMEGAAPWPNR